jgi:hypothetical protein
MDGRHSRISTLCLALLAAPLLQSCAEISANVSKAVAMKYVHVANVKMIQVQIGGSQSQLVGVDNGSFWAVFDICSIDVQGSALTGFSYNANSFFIDAGTVKYGVATPGVVNVSSVPLSSQSPQVTSAVHDAFGLSPSTQFFPKQFYPNLKYRIAIFVKENPTGYVGDTMTLQYDGQPQVAALVQNVASTNPDFRPFYNHGVSPQIVGTCP